MSGYNGKTLTIHLVAAARPNFMKIAPLYHALKKQKWARPIIVHTGQHYDVNMSDEFFKDLRLPNPDIHLNVGSSSHAEQTGRVLMAYERILIGETPDLVVVVGDVNSTMAATLAAVKLGIKVAHLESGLRSFDRTMPEEINRIVTDALADVLWTPSKDADENLLKEGVPSQRIHRVGNIMIDSLEMLRSTIENQLVFEQFELSKRSYAVATLHRPANVDSRDDLKKACLLLAQLSKRIPIIFPIHPRTRRNLIQGNLMPLLLKSNGLRIVEPLGYIKFMNLVFNCRLVITDSGGVQEETTYLGIPCLTLRPNTERPITVTHGTNRICSLEDLESAVTNALAARMMHPANIDFWDGRTAERVVRSIETIFNGKLQGEKGNN